MAEAVLLTGGTGYVAGWCVARLLDDGYDVRTTVRDASRGERVRRAVAAVSPRADRLEFAVADLTSDDGWKEAADGCAYVLHVASPLAGADMLGPARDGTLRVLRAAAAAGVRRVVMTAPAAAGERFLATGEFLWMRDIASALREGLGEEARKVPTRQLPDIAVQVASLFDRSLRDIMPGLGRRNRHSIEKARSVLGWSPRPTRTSVVDCGRSLLEHDAVG